MSGVDVETIAVVRDMVQGYVASQERVGDHPAATAGSNVDHDRAAWSRYAEMGWLGVSLPAAAGGFDGDPAIVAEIMAGVGSGLLKEPVLASAVLSGRLVGLLDPGGGSGFDQQRIATGEAILAFASIEETGDAPWERGRSLVSSHRLRGRKIAVLHGDVATHLLFVANDDDGYPAVALVEAGAPGVCRQEYALLDGRSAATVEVDTRDFILLGKGEAAWEALERALDEGMAALCAEALGAIGRLNMLTRSYLAERQQFGRPIGANQVLQHRMVESLILETEVAAVAAKARHMLGRNDARARSAFVSGAMAVTAAAARHIAHDAVQMHGGIGMTHEHAVSHYFKRLRVIELLLGQRSHHMRRFMELR